MAEDERKYWFRAKRYDWGWGLPGTWQGWVVLIFRVAAFILGRRYLLPQNTYVHLAFALAMLGLLLSICYKIRGTSAMAPWPSRLKITLPRG
jgi:hypothetical protein